MHANETRQQVIDLVNAARRYQGMADRAWEQGQTGLACQLLVSCEDRRSEAKYLGRKLNNLR